MKEVDKFIKNKKELLDYHKNNFKKYETVSAIIPSYNRCPYPVELYYMNPLIWMIYSLANQKYSSLKEVVIVNDGSTDYTDDNIKFMGNKFKNSHFSIIYIKNESNKNPCVSRNIGAVNASAQLIFFLDDDCILSDLALAGLLATRESLKKENRIGAIHIPVFLRTEGYSDIKPLNKIGKLNLLNGTAFTNFRSFPHEYLLSEKVEYLLDTPYIKPVNVDFFQEVFLIERSLFNESGGFIEDCGFEYIQHEGLFLTTKLNKKKLSHYQIVDPNIYTIHFRYGNVFTFPQTTDSCYQLKIDNKYISLKTMIEESSVSRVNTGNRTNLENIMIDSISGRYALFLYYNKDSARLWADHTYQALVNDNDPHDMLKVPKNTFSKEQLESIWEKSIEKGKEVYEKKIINENWFC